jgi:hypothetical protein
MPITGRKMSMSMEEENQTHAERIKTKVGLHEVTG